MKLVFLDADTLHRDDLDFSAFEEFGELVFHPRTGPEETAERLAEAEVVITNKVVLTRELLSEAAKLKLVCIAATGTNCVDLEAAKELGIPVCNVSGYSTPGVAQHTFALILSLVTSLHRYLPEAQKWAQAPLFTRLDHPVMELEGRTLGIVGLGTIGKEVARIAQAFGMKVVALARPGASVVGDIPRLPAEEFFPACEIVSLHCPLTADTEKLIREETLALFRPGAFLINTGRGPLIDDEALASALREGRLGGAGLDVLSTEPPPADHPLLDPDLPNLLITPHTAWAGRESRSRLLEGIVKNIRGFLVGDLPNRVA